MDDERMLQFNGAIKVITEFRSRALKEYPVIIREGLKSECNVKIIGPPSQIDQTQREKAQEAFNYFKGTNIDPVDMDQTRERLAELEYIKSTPEYNVFKKLDSLQ